MKSPLGQRKWQPSLAILTLCMITILCGGCGLLNHEPVIESLIAERTVVKQTESISIECIASDPDEDELIYQWTASGGDIVRYSSTITWTAPYTPGTYIIAVTAADGRGSETTMQLTIEVPVNHPPIIESLRVERIPIRPYEPIPIKCVSSDPDVDELSYRWTVTGGSISGGGSEVIWIAPDTGGEYFITVEVTDDRGEETSKKLLMRLRAPSG